MAAVSTSFLETSENTRRVYPGIYPVKNPMNFKLKNQLAEPGPGKKTGISRTGFGCASLPVAHKKPIGAYLDLYKPS